MKVKVRLFSTLIRFSPGEGGEFMLEMGDSTSPKDIPDLLEMPAAVDRIILVNGRHARPETVLQAGDQVTLFPPMTGG